MKFDLKGKFIFSSDVSSIKDEIKDYITTTSSDLFKKDAELFVSNRSYWLLIKYFFGGVHASTPACILDINRKLLYQIPILPFLIII